MGLVVLAVILINLTPVQNYIARQAVGMLARKLDTKVSVQHVRIDFLNHVLLQGLYIEDKAHDTLLYAGEARVRITDWFLLKKDKPVLRYVGLHNAYVHLYRKAKSDQWNYQFIADAFDTGPSDGTKKQNEFELDLEKVDISNVRVHMDDAWVGTDMDFDVGKLDLDAEDIDLKKKVIDVNKLFISKAIVAFRDYEGGRPPRPRKPRVLDTTAFNTGGWLVKMDKLELDDCYFGDEMAEDEPVPNEFDTDHIRIGDIYGLATDIHIVGDTIRGQIKHMEAKERCGIVIKELRTDATVSPNATICKNLYLETNNSVLRDYYAMHYTRFPDFTDYIDKVVMVGNFKDAKIDSRDVSYFAPDLRNLSTIVYASGRVGGSVDSLVATKMNVSDGYSTIKGNLKMIGLPDINTTWIDYREGEIYTTGNGILKYAPQLRDNPNIALQAVSHAYFKGNFIGYIDNFAANGVLTSNLGTITSDVGLKIPDMVGSRAAYRGTVSTVGFNAGALFRQPDLGLITLRAGVSGNSFEAHNAQLKINAVIDRLDYRGYPYQNITADGLLAKNLFNGNLLVDDPNLALAFTGDIDFNHDQLRIDARANLLHSDLTALKFTPSDSVTASADFDLDWTGNNLDDFLGYARLYNINVIRNNHHLDIDSVYVLSQRVDSMRQLVIESNALSARINGNYQLSSLPYSVQYYISQYLPNYIKEPEKFAAAQDIKFTVTTHELDSLFGVLVPQLSGFNQATITGALNTSQQKLLLNAQIPYGKIDAIRLRNATITGDGNYELLGLNASAENVTVGDSVLTGSMSVTTTVGNDSLLFNIATNSSSDDYGTVTLNGRAYAREDSLFFNILPSEFFLKRKKWEIQGGSDIIVSGKYLYVNNLQLQSGLQQIAVSSRDELGKNILGVGIRNIDVALVGSLAGLSAYQPEGRINGNVNIENVHGDMIIEGNIKATDVKLGTDTIGNISLVGRYDAQKRFVKLDPQSGIYYKDASITAAGNVLFDSSATGKERLDGLVRFQNAPIAWATPFLEGFMSELGGTLNGDIIIGGTARMPDIDGQVYLNDVKLKLDVLGTRYTVRNATVTVNNDSIDLGNINIYDAHKNTAILTGKVYHDRFTDFTFNLNAGSSKFEVMNLKEYENDLFYGNLIAGFQNLSIRGPLDDIAIRITRAMPRAESHLYLPITESAEISTYSFVTFQTYGTDQQVVKKKESRLSINIDANLNELAEITLVLDPTTGDAINARGTGNITIDMPANNELRMNGVYAISEGNYTFTLSQLFFKRIFSLTGGRIDFNGSIAQTSLNVDGVYTARARLYDLLNANEKSSIEADPKEAQETKAAQDINILLNMQGTLDEPKITFKLDVPNKRTAGTFAYTKLMSYNQDERQLFNQVASLLLINRFIPPDDGGSDQLGNAAATGAISNISSVLSSTASTQLTNLVNRLDKELSIDLKYNPYTASSSANGTLNRNEVYFGVRRNYYNNRLTLEVGSSVDWGRSAGSSTVSNFNPVGDFRAQYQLKEGGNLRLNIFRTSSYDAIENSNISRNGVGLSWKKTFNSFSDLFNSRSREQLELLQQNLNNADTTNQNKEDRTGTW